MIARIRGKVVEKREQSLLLELAGVTYEVLVPVTTMQRIDEAVSEEGTVSLVTYHYYHIEPSRGIPVLIGFLNEIEKEFFLAFITVSGIGPKAALKALNQPISLIARAIDEGNTAFLKSLPGIGQQRAKEIVAKLQNKVGKFGLLQDNPASVEKAASGAGAAVVTLEEEALAVLLQLGYRRPEAAGMIRKALDRDFRGKTTEELLNEVYRQKKSVTEGT